MTNFFNRSGMRASSSRRITWPLRRALQQRLERANQVLGFFLQLDVTVAAGHGKRPGS